jgi:hypothetical protein
MKKQIIVYSFILFALLGCKKIDKLTQFNMEFNESIVIPSSTGINLPFNILTPDVATNAESTFAVNDTRKDLIEEIKLTKLTLTLTAPPNGDFGFLKSISVFISADGLSETKIAWKDVVPSDIGAVLNLEVSDTDLKDFIMKDNFKLKLNTVTDELLTSDHHIDIKSVFFVDAKILGQ